MSVEQHILEAGQELSNDRYLVTEYLGAGGMQEVYFADDTLMNRPVALKVPKNDSAIKRFADSAKLSARINHPNVAKTLDYFVEDDKQFLVEELIIGEDLRTFADRFLSAVTDSEDDEEEDDDQDDDGVVRNAFDPYFVAYVFHHLAKGLAASHAANVVHRDLKPNNVMVLGGTAFGGIKITDFGIAKLAEEEISELQKDKLEKTIHNSTMFGAIPYASPEWLKKASRAKAPSDIWSIASICAELLLGRKPFNESFTAAERIRKARHYPLRAWVNQHSQFKQLANELLDIFKLCWQLKPADRPSADNLVELAGQLCYRPIEREFGVVESYKGPYNFGLLRASSNRNVFFHTANVFHEAPRLPLNSRVWFSKYSGSPYDRAFPIIPLNV